jgi:hypothetical protein
MRILCNVEFGAPRIAGATASSPEPPRHVGGGLGSALRSKLIPVHGARMAIIAGNGNGSGCRDHHHNQLKSRAEPDKSVCQFRMVDMPVMDFVSTSVRRRWGVCFVRPRGSEVREVRLLKKKKKKKRAQRCRFIR